MMSYIKMVNYIRQKVKSHFQQLFKLINENCDKTFFLNLSRVQTQVYLIKIIEVKMNFLGMMMNILGQLYEDDPLLQFGYYRISTF